MSAKNKDDWHSSLDNGQLVGLVGIDLKKLWIKILNRKQYCSINGIESELMDIDIGVPQGSYVWP